jgi:glycosyltransferase involved in cell wall biosynthesis
MPAVAPPNDIRSGDGRPEVSVVIPTFNRVSFLPSAIASARAQTLTDIEIIIVDDGSTDDTPSLTAALAGRDPRIRTIRQENRGLAAARNAGLACARARWVAFLDDDDLWHPDFLSHMLAFVQQHHLQAAACWTVQFSAPPPIDDAVAILADRSRFAVAPYPPCPATMGVITVAELLLRPLATPNAAFLSADLVRRLGGFDERLSSAEDYDLWLRLAQTNPIRIVDDALALYRIHPARLTSSLGRMAQQTRLVLERFSFLHPESVQLVGRRAFAHRLADLYREEAYAAMLSGDRATAMRAALKAVRCSPAGLKSWAYVTLAPWPALYRALRRVIRSRSR